MRAPIVTPSTEPAMPTPTQSLCASRRGYEFSEAEARALCLEIDEAVVRLFVAFGISEIQARRIVVRPLAADRPGLRLVAWITFKSARGQRVNQLRLVRMQGARA